MTSSTILLLNVCLIAGAPAEDCWALQPLARHEPPQHDSPWVRTPVDAFIFAKLKENGLAASPEADRRTLIRRLTYNLHELPPAPAEIEAFVKDTSPDAYEKLIDRLLESPRYGERWGRHWLDVVHFGETHGYDKDKRRPNAWPFRDYVIRSLNQDKPYSRFVEEQFAGDVLFPDDSDGVVTTGFSAALTAFSSRPQGSLPGPVRPHAAFRRVGQWPPTCPGRPPSCGFLQHRRLAAFLPWPG